MTQPSLDAENVRCERDEGREEGKEASINTLIDPTRRELMARYYKRHLFIAWYGIFSYLIPGIPLTDAVGNSLLKGHI
jgi:hypothetical protein